MADQENVETNSSRSIGLFHSGIAGATHYSRSVFLLSLFSWLSVARPSVMAPEDDLIKMRLPISGEPAEKHLPFI